MAERICGPCSRGQHAPCDGQNEFWGDCTCWCNVNDRGENPEYCEGEGDRSESCTHDTFSSRSIGRGMVRSTCHECGEATDILSATAQADIDEWSSR